MRQNDEDQDEDQVDELSNSRSKKCKEVMRRAYNT